MDVMSCPYCPDKPAWEPDPSYDNPNCICNKPMMIYIPAGQHIHCPVHPKYVVYGSPITCNAGCVYEHDSSKDLTFDSTRPFGTATGDNIRDSYKVIC